MIGDYNLYLTKSKNCRYFNWGLMSDYYWKVAVNVSLMEEQTVLPYNILIGDDYNERTCFLFFERERLRKRENVCEITGEKRCTSNRNILSASDHTTLNVAITA